jgi:hypothetical protein
VSPFQASHDSKVRDAEPQRAEIELQMEKEDSKSAEVPGRTRWIIEGIKLQEEQWVAFLIYRLSLA